MPNVSWLCRNIDFEVWVQKKGLHLCQKAVDKKKTQDAMHQFISSSSLLKLKMGLYNFFMAVYVTTKNKFQQRRNRLLFSVFLLGERKMHILMGSKNGQCLRDDLDKVGHESNRKLQFQVYRIRASRLWSGPTTPWFSLWSIPNWHFRSLWHVRILLNDHDSIAK